MKLLRHLVTITKHKLLVLKYCCRIKLYWRGFMHDWSKYSFTELKIAKYYQGNRSPISAERKEIGYSEVYLHHKGRNKHHLEYWTDFVDQGLAVIRIPYKYLAEMVCDMLAAGRVYSKKSWNPSQPLEYFNRHLDKYQKFLHPDTYNFLLTVLTDLSESSLKRVLNRKYLKNLYNQNRNYDIVIFH